ncbi:DUF6497 family protein [Roseobacter ponti]|uniref:DUF6497 family protein n=1 Tax=Roseobacter ponti TaxID=1891787 RepID=UPI001FE70BAE|nr:DUF6497 family protein [Roseobacter ponti]
MSTGLTYVTEAAGVPDALQVPSGQAMDLFEVLVDRVDAETWIRFRFVAPSIARARGEISFFDVQDDFEHLCTRVALPYLKERDLSADAVVVSLLDRPAEFGQADDTLTQFIEVFRIKNGICAWEAL